MSSFKEFLMKVVKFCEARQLNWTDKIAVSILAPRVTFFDHRKALTVILKLAGYSIEWCHSELGDYYLKHSIVPCY